jgi:hypothetical protein
MHSKPFALAETSGGVPQDHAGGAQARRWAPAASILALLAVLALALWIQGDSLSAPLISEDSSVLAYCQREPALSDWDRPQYDLRTVRFWRPLMTLGMDLQTAWTGANPSALRAFNWICQALALLGLWCLGRRLGGVLPGLIAALWAASFPFQGGTVTWVVGRVDGQCLPALCWAAWAGLAGRPWALMALTLLAFGTKESGVLAPLWALAGALASGRTWRSNLRLLLPCALLLAGLLWWRARSLGTFAGGYVAQPASGPADWLASLPSLAGADPSAALVLVAALALGATGRERRVALGFALCGLLGLALLLPMLAGGPLALEHRRWWALPDACAGIAAAALLSRLASRGGVRHGLLLVLLAVCAARAVQARQDVAAWRDAGRAAAEFEARLRAAQHGLPADPRPLLALDVPRLDPEGRAYVLHFGLADRFRPPSAPAPREVWPWRLMFAEEAASRREALGPTLAAGLLASPGESGGGLPLLQAEARLAGAPAEELWVDAGLVAPQLPGTGPEVWLRPPGQPGQLEALLITELGYGGALWQAAPFGSETDWKLPLRELLLSQGQFRLLDVLAQAADFGADRAYLELRWLDASGSPVAVAPWIPLRWPRELRNLLLPLRPER